MPFAESLKVIVLGSDISSKNEEKIELIARKYSIPLYKLDWEYSIPMIDHGPYMSWARRLKNPF
ncbi:MAG: hypothetical protein BalsKO_07150 [Balneolaceae bacterium]